VTDERRKPSEALIFPPGLQFDQFALFFKQGQQYFQHAARLSRCFQNQLASEIAGYIDAVALSNPENNSAGFREIVKS
jgi:hypothetical protein